MPHFTHHLHVETRGRGLYNVTESITDWVRAQKIATGLLTVFIQHTSASLLIQENADPDVIRDLNAFFARLVPDGDRLFKHTAEGPDDMPAHIRATLTQTSLSVPLHKGQLAFGAWQGLYVFEHRAIPRKRSLILHLAGDA